MKEPFYKTWRAGGVEETITSNFDLDSAMRREYTRACVALVEELKLAGLLTVFPRVRSGDYTTQTMELRFP